MSQVCDVHSIFEKMLEKISVKTEENSDSITRMKTTMHVWFVLLAVLIPGITWILLNGVSPVIKKAEASYGKAGVYTELPSFIGKSVDISFAGDRNQGGVHSEDTRTTNPHDPDFVGELK